MIDVKARGSGYYRVYVDGVQLSQHTTEREAEARAIDEAFALAFTNPSAKVYYKHDYEVDVTIDAVEANMIVTGGGVITPGDETPDSITDAFTDQTDVGTSQTIPSNSVQVTGFNVPVAISVDVGEYRINGGGWTAIAGTIENLDYIELQHTSSSSNSTATNQIVTIGGVSDTFTSTTEAAVGFATTSPQSSVTQYGITWTFDTDYEVGQFVNGDYFVIDPDDGVTISSVSPDSSVSGSQLNPGPGDWHGLNSNADEQRYNAALRASFPLSVSSGDSLISSENNTSQVDGWAGQNYSTKAPTLNVAVLTVLDTVPYADTLRPSYSDRSHTLYRASNLNTSILPGHSTAGISPLVTRNGYVGTDYHVRGLERPWLLFVDDWVGRGVHASNNMFWYHGDVGGFLGELMAVLISDLVTDDIINKFCVLILDYYHASIDPSGGDAVDSCGWSFPLILGGLLLDNSDIYNHWIDNPTAKTERDQEKFFYPEDNPYYATNYSSSMITAGQNWYGWVHPTSGKVPMFAKFTDYDGVNYSPMDSYMEHLHPSEWNKTWGTTLHTGSEDYRGKYDVYPIIGMVLALREVDKLSALDVLGMVNIYAAVEYADFWMDIGWETNEYQSSGMTYDAYLLDQSGFRVSSNRRYDGGGSAFVTEMWNTYRGAL